MNLRTPPASAFIAGSVVGPLVLPAAKKNSKPLKGERADGGVMTFASLALLLVAASGPIGRSNRVSSPFMKGLTHKLRAGPPEVDPLTLSTSLHDRCDTTVGLEFGSRYETVSPAPDGSNDARHHYFSSPGQRLENGKIGMSSADHLDLLVERGNPVA